MRNQAVRGENSGDQQTWRKKYYIFILSNQNVAFPFVMVKGNKPVALTESVTLSPMKS